jgi:hypothetical protein
VVGCGHIGIELPFMDAKFDIYLSVQAIVLQILPLIVVGKKSLK